MTTAAHAHTGHHRPAADQERYGVRYLRYWVGEQAGRIFCLVDAPDAEAAVRVHTP